MNSFTQHVGGGNYTHYKLTKEGDVRLVLNTIEGDADLYISDNTLYPDYENYELQAVSCGEDTVFISDDFERPIGIAVYGHPSHDQSYFQLDVYVSDVGQASEQSFSVPSKKGLNTKRNSEGEEQESILWNIFVGLLKIIFDVLL